MLARRPKQYLCQYCDFVTDFVEETVKHILSAHPNGSVGPIKFQN